MAPDSFPSVLKVFGSSLGIDGLALDEYGTCSLAIDEVLLSLRWASDSQTLLVYAPVGMIDLNTVDKNQLVELLEANCLGQGTGGLTLGLEPGFGAIVLSGQLSTHNLEPFVLERFIEFFCGLAEDWSRRLAQAPNGAPSGRPAVPESPDMPVGIRA
jgi:hypothetical protein